MRVERKLITPTLATALLEKNTQNRNVNPSRVDRYAREMINNNWLEDTGEMIKISKTDVVLDGQHRLLAVIKSNRCVIMHVAFDLNDNIFKTLDTGKSRCAADIFKISGVKNATNVAALLQLYNNLFNNKNKAQKVSNNSSLTPQELLELYYERPDYWQDVIRFAQTNYNAFQKIWNLTDLATITAILDNVDYNLSRKFIEEICKGVNVTHDVISILRNIMIADKINSKQKLQISHRRALVIKAWNYYYTKREIKLLRYTPDLEKYPEIIGLM